MTKIAIDRGVGGFTLSDLAVLRLYLMGYRNIHGIMNAGFTGAWRREMAGESERRASGGFLMWMNDRHARHTLILFSLIWVVLGEPYASALKYTWLASWPKLEVIAAIVVWVCLLFTCSWALTYLIARVMHRHRLH